MEGNSLDVYKQTPIRYLGYSNEVGEAFRSIIGNRWVNLSYAVATLYVLADTTDKSIKSHKWLCHHVGVPEYPILLVAKLRTRRN
ncbi:hypothetical protein JTB14_023251 [Gonioctena quinquepunctata]|nr:hypothetical protein JTB14_023251 [Gonioctena quinquepunctata]